MKARKRKATGSVVGTGAVATLLRERDLAATSLGAPATWPDGLVSLVGTILGSPQPMLLWWGADRALLYNDAAADLLGARHPTTLLAAAPQPFPENAMLAHAIAAVADGSRASARETAATDAGAWTLALGPVRDETGEVAGVLAVAQVAASAAERPRIAARSDTPARGTRFAPWPVARILLAEGDGAVRAHLAGLLGERWSVETVSDGDAALAVLRERPADLVLAQAALPGLDGWALVRQLRAEVATSRAPVLLRGPQDQSAVEALECGADDYLAWPADDREIVARVAGHLERSRLREDANRRERAARAEAESANRAKDEFLAMVSHELRAPLGAILIWTQLLRNERLDEAATDRALGMIERSTRTLTQIIDDLLDVSRIITGKLSLNPYPVDVAAVIESAIAAAKPGALAKGVQLEGALDRRVGFVSGDAGRLQQVVGNLLSNAVKFTPEGGTVRVRLDAAAGQARISVADTGVGISQDFLPYIFERFRQADSTSTRTEKGLGLGLSISRHLVELHAGTIEAESSGEGHGSTFTVMLPMLTQDGIPAASTSAGPPERLETSQLRGVRLLVVDDDDDAREGLAVLLGQWGADVTAVSSVDDALAAIESVQPHVLLSDIAMPGADGYSLVRRVRALPSPLASIPAAALTAYATADDRRRALGAGFQDHLAKPVDPQRLMAVVLELSRLARR
jgi:signal transduction histidine kinase